MQPTSLAVTPTAPRAAARDAPAAPALTLAADTRSVRLAQLRSEEIAELGPLLHRISLLKWPATVVCVIFLVRFAWPILRGGTRLPVDALGIGLVFWGFAMGLDQLTNPRTARHARLSHRANVVLANLWALICLAFIGSAFVLVIVGEIGLTDYVTIGMLSVGVQGLGMARSEMTRVGHYG